MKHLQPEKDNIQKMPKNFKKINRNQLISLGQPSLSIDQTKLSQALFSG
jgi:hypothetical protein